MKLIEKPDSFLPVNPGMFPEGLENDMGIIITRSIGVHSLHEVVNGSRDHTERYLEEDDFLAVIVPYQAGNFNVLGQINWEQINNGGMLKDIFAKNGEGVFQVRLGDVDLPFVLSREVPGHKIKATAISGVGITYEAIPKGMS